MKIQRISIVVPCFNEKQTIGQIIEKINTISLEMAKEVIIVDDGSTDGTKEKLKALQEKYPKMQVYFHGKNLGKGAAIKTAIKYATGDYIIVQDADLEYDPNDIRQLIKYAEEHDLLVVYGSRNLMNNSYKYWHYYIGGRVVTLFTNLIYRQKLTDQATGYKLIHRELIQFINLQENDFSFCSEVTAKISNLGIKIYEVPIKYYARSFAEGKKIRISNGFKAIFILIKYFINDGHFNLIDRIIRFFRIRKIGKYYNFLKQDSVIDFGSGTSAVLGWKFKNKINKYTAVDKYIRPGQIQNLHFIQQDIDNVSGDSQYLESCNAIFALAIIEHLVHPEKFIKNCYLILKQQGIIFITTPSPAAKPILELLSMLHIISRDEINDHKQYFSLNKLQSILENNKFSIIKKKKFLFGLNNLVIAKKI